MPTVRPALRGCAYSPAAQRENRWRQGIPQRAPRRLFGSSGLPFPGFSQKTPSKAALAFLGLFGGWGVAPDRPASGRGCLWLFRRRKPSPRGLPFGCSVRPGSRASQDRRQLCRSFWV